MFFVDAAHFVFGTFLCCLWSFTRLFVRAASGRQRFNVLGAWNAITRKLVAVTNTTVVNTDTMCELLRKIAAEGLTGPITLVLDNARYQRNAVVMALAEQLGITLMFLPSYSPNLGVVQIRVTTLGRPLSGQRISSLSSTKGCQRRRPLWISQECHPRGAGSEPRPNLNLIERLWKFTKRRSLYGRYHPTFADFRAAIEQILAEIPTQHATALASLMTLNFQRFENVSLLAA